MAFVHMRIAGPTLAPEQVQRLQKEMTDIVSDTLGRQRHAISVLVEPAPARGWAVGGERPNMLGHVSVTAVTGLTSGQKTACVAQAHGLLRRVLGGELTPFTYVVVNESPADAWGYDGITQAGREGVTGPSET